MLLKTSCKTIIFPLKKLKICKKIKKVNFKTRIHHPLLFDFNQHNTLVDVIFSKLLHIIISIYYFYRSIYKN
jgi:hypothetical protein